MVRNVLKACFSRKFSLKSFESSGENSYFVGS